MVNPMKYRIIATLLLLSMMLCSTALGAEKGMAATSQDAEATVRDLLKEPWLPSDVTFNCEAVDGFWRSGLSRGNEAVGELFVDGNRAQSFVYIRMADCELPELKELVKGRQRATREDLETGAAYRDEAKAIFLRLRGTDPEPNETVACEYRISVNEWLFGLEYPGEQLGAVLILRAPEDKSGPLQLRAYVDMHRNRSARYPGCQSIDQIVAASLAACEKDFGRETAAQLQLENAVMVVGNAVSYSMAYGETGIAPQVPFWTVSLLDMRAQPDSPDYDEQVELYRYHILVNPFDGEILEIWTEDFGWG